VERGSSVFPEIFGDRDTQITTFHGGGASLIIKIEDFTTVG
jgi:hypothetical protein